MTSSPRPTPLERAIERGDWEAAALHTLIALARALQQAPQATLDDLLAALVEPEDADASDR